MTKRNSSHKQKHGFTLIELLVVMAIIAILMGLVVGVSGAVMRKSAVSRAWAEMSDLMNEIELYRADVGAYPSSYRSGDNHVAGNRDIMVLRKEKDPTNPLKPGFRDWYEAKYPNTVFTTMAISSKNGHEYFVDPWGSPLIYKDVKEFVYLIGSYGPNGSSGISGSKQFGKGDDITNRNGAL
jgi:prepilin-type N-terminal cleavage/methylation domain-containing protein